MADIIVIHGYPGAGKTTQADRFAEDSAPDDNIIHVSAGNRLRDIRTGLILSEHTDIITSPDAPSPLPDDVVNGVVFEPIETVSGYVLALVDGYPRHPSALKVFMNRIESHGHRYLGAVVMEVTLEASLQRVKDRGERHGEKLNNRSLAELAKKRFNDHKLMTLEAIDLLAAFGHVETIDANGDEDDVREKFRIAIGRLATRS